MDKAEAGSRIVDIGAGVNPLVPYLTAHGYEVHTVDPSREPGSGPPNRIGPVGDSSITPPSTWPKNHGTARLKRCPSTSNFDVAYSISVIEHLTADDRRGLFHALAQRVRPGGTVVLTVDLARNTNDLWNKAQGQVVESVRHHGSLGGLVREAKQVGFAILDVQVVRHWSDRPIDIGLLVLHREARPAQQARPPTALESVGPQFMAMAHKLAKSVRSRVRTGSTA